MGRTEEPIVQTKKDDHGERFEHPAFGQISVSRVQGGGGVLYGTDFEHRSYIALRINRSELNRNLSHDWHFEREQYIEVYLSEAQWATFVSSFNVGGGVPCTVNFLKDIGLLPAIPKTSKKDEFIREADDKLASALASLEKLIEDVEGMNLPKGKTAEIKSRAERVRMHLTSNMDFVSNSFRKHVENTVEKAKVEIHGYMNGVITGLGLEAMQKNAPPRIEEDKTAPKGKITIIKKTQGE